jgi:hypothetical protein
MSELAQTVGETVLENRYRDFAEEEHQRIQRGSTPQ